MEIKTMSVEELQARKVEIEAEIDSLESIEEVNARSAEVDEINAELEARKQLAQEKAEVRAKVAEGAGETIETIPEERKQKMDINEIRNSKEYINAYAEYIKSGDPAECRALLSENAQNGTVAVPDYVYEITKTAWEREGIMSRVRKSYIKGNLKVGFEISSTAAQTHSEGVAVDEENLVLGVAELVPQSIKKWISISDEAMDLRGTEFLDYIYDELAYRIAKKAADMMVALILATDATGSASVPAQAIVTANAIAMGTVAQAIANLSDEAANPVLMMNKLTWSAFKQVQYANGYGADPFEGLPVVFNDTIPAFSAASTGDTYLIVGDLDHGALANFPAGQEITFKYDDMTLATQDLVRIIGREFVALGIVAPKSFVQVQK